MTNKDLHELMIRWLSTLLGIVVIKDRQQGGRPQVPYGMLELANWRDLHEHIDRRRWTEDSVESDREVEWVFLFYAYGPTAADHVRRLQAAVHVDQAMEPVRPLFSVHSVSAANNLPELVGQKWEDRVQVNIVVRGVVTTEFSADTADKPDIIITRQ